MRKPVFYWKILKMNKRLLWVQASILIKQFNLKGISQIMFSEVCKYWLTLHLASCGFPGKADVCRYFVYVVIWLKLVPIKRSIFFLVLIKREKKIISKFTITGCQKFSIIVRLTRLNGIHMEEFMLHTGYYRRVELTRSRTHVHMLRYTPYLQHPRVL